MQLQIRQGIHILLLDHLYKSIGRAKRVTTAFPLVKVFKRLYLMKFEKKVVHTCPDVRYRSEV